jgi:hypothetical protein
VRGPVWRGSVRAGRDALPRDPAWRVNAGWITNGRDSITVLYVPIGAYSRLRFIGQATPDRAGARPNHLQRGSPNLDESGKHRVLWDSGFALPSQ